MNLAEALEAFVINQKFLEQALMSGTKIVVHQQITYLTMEFRLINLGEQQYIDMIMQHQGGEKSKIKKSISGMSIIEALVATVIVGVGLVTVLQLATYVTQSIDRSIQKNKINYLSEMMMEDMFSVRTGLNAYARTFGCSVTLSNNQNLSDLRLNQWQSNFKNSLDGGLDAANTRCTNNDAKQVTLSNQNTGAKILLRSDNGKVERNLGAIIR